jgi:hypothetical protein
MMLTRSDARKNLWNFVGYSSAFKCPSESIVPSPLPCFL